jgi:hypothetical protein
MARRFYTLGTYHKDKTMLNAVWEKGITFEGPLDAWTHRNYERAVAILSKRTPRGLLYSGRNQRVLVEDASPGQVYSALQKYVTAARKNTARFEQHLGSSASSRRSLEDRIPPSGGIQQETLFGQDAEDLGYCGCFPVSRYIHRKP